VPADLVLVDEPTASLDADGAALVWAALERRRQYGATIVVATHDERAVKNLRARQITLEQGRLVEDSPADISALA
jgi:ABC-type ATPase involved in cell division